MRFLVALALLAVAGRSATAGAQSAHPYDLFLSDWRPPPGQRCDLGEAPALSALVDTAALDQRLSGGGTNGSVLLAWTRPDTILWRPEYGPMFDSLFLVERRMADSAARQIHDAVLATLQQSKDAPSGALLRLDFDGQGHLTLRTARALQCPPSIINDSSMDKYHARLRAIAGKEPRNAVIGFIVGRDGATHAARIITPSGDGAFDMAAVDLSAILHYRPALYNRVPVAVNVRLPVHIQQRMQ